MPFRVSTAEMARFMMPKAIYEASRPHFQDLTSPFVAIRLRSLETIKNRIDHRDFPELPARNAMGNHYHGKHSWGIGFPSLLVLFSAANGLAVTGLVDHYTLAGADEFRKASAVFGIPSTVGYEVRALVRNSLMAGGTDLSRAIINSPGNPGEVYVVFHGVPVERSSFLYCAHNSKLARYKSVAEKLDQLLISKRMGLRVSFEEIALASQLDNVLDRHVTEVLFDKLFDASRGDFARILAMVTDLSEGPSEKESKALEAADAKESPMKEYAKYMVISGMLRDRLLKNGKTCFIEPDAAECPGLGMLHGIARHERSILTYPYLGLEDAYLNELAALLFKALHFSAVSAMHDRNTPEQIKKIEQVSVDHSVPLFSGMDVNNWTQRFINPFSYRPELIKTAMLLVDHEKRGR